MSLIQIETPFNIDLEFEIAEVYKRLFAYLADFTILLFYFISMKYFYYGGFNLAGIETLKSHMGLDILDYFNSYVIVFTRLRSDDAWPNDRQENFEHPHH